MLNKKEGERPSLLLYYVDESQENPQMTKRSFWISFSYWIGEDDFSVVVLNVMFREVTNSKAK